MLVAFVGQRISLKYKLNTYYRTMTIKFRMCYTQSPCVREQKNNVDTMAYHAFCCIKSLLETA